MVVRLSFVVGKLSHSKIGFTIAKLEICGCETQFWCRIIVTFKDWVYACLHMLYYTCTFTYMYASTNLAFQSKETFQDRLPMA